MQARSTAARSQWDLQSRIYERELSLCIAEGASRVFWKSAASSSSLDSQIAGIQKVLAEYGVASIADTDILLLLKTNLTSYDRIVDPSKIGRAFRCLEAYALNLYHRPWKKEYYRLKRYCGFYKTYVDAYLRGVEVVFYRIGYTLNDDNSEWRMGGIDSPEWAGEVARSCLDIAFYCCVAAVECDSVAIACAQMGDLAYPPTRVFFHRLEHPALPRDTALQLRMQSHKSTAMVAAAATTPVGSSRLLPASGDSIATGLSRAKPSATAQAAAVATSVLGSRLVQLQMQKELSDSQAGGTSSISMDSRVIRMPPPITVTSSHYVVGSGTPRPAASANSLLPTFRHHEPVEMAEPSRSSHDDVDNYRGDTGEPWHPDRTRSATAVPPSASAGIVDRGRLLLPASFATGEPRPLSLAGAASAGHGSASPPMLLPPVAAGFARISVAAAADDVPRLADAWPTSQHNRAGSGSPAAHINAIDDALPTVSPPSWEPEEATADEHMAMSLQLLEEPALRLPPPPAFSGSHEASSDGMIARDKSNSMQLSGPGSELQGFNYREPLDRPQWLASATGRGSSGNPPGSGSSSAGGDGGDFSLMQFSIREPPVGASFTEWPGSGIDRLPRTAKTSVSTPLASRVDGDERGSVVQSKPSASYPQYGASTTHNTASSPQYPRLSGSEEAAGQRKHFSIYSRIDK